MSLLSSSRCVLILGDEGLQIYNVGRLNTKFVEFLPWDTVDFETSVRDLLVGKCNRKPIVILNDMVEQHYRKERIPKVSILDRGNILKRRLGVAFPNYRIKAALKLSEKNSSHEGGVKSNSYLFAAVPNSDFISKTMEAIRLASAPIVGFYLLPIEASAMVSDCSIKLMKSEGRKQKSVWTIFVGQHHSGGLRQVVARNGELALTRMTPIIDTDVEPDLWAKEVVAELTATMSYLARFGYKEQDGLDIIVIANESSKTSLETQIEIDCNLRVMTSQQVAGVLGTNLGHQEELRYADPLYVSYLGRKNRFLLPMKSAAIDRLTQPRQMASLLMAALLIGCLYFGFLAFQKWKNYANTKDQLLISRQQASSLKEEQRREVAKQKELGYDFLYVNNSIKIYEELSNQKIKPLPVITVIGRALGADLSLDNLEIKSEQVKVEKSEDPYAYETEEEQYKFYIDITLTTSFPSTIDPEVGVELINSFKQRLVEALPDYEVTVARQVADLSYTGNFVGEAGDSTTEEGVQDDYIAEIKIRGEVK